MSSNNDKKVDLNDLSSIVAPEQIEVKPAPTPGFFESIGIAVSGIVKSGDLSKAMIRPININGKPMRK